MREVKRLIFFVFCFLFVLSCSKTPKVECNPEKDPIHGLASVIMINPDNNIVYLEDYILDFSSVDSVYYSAGDFEYNEDNNTLKILSEFDDIPALSVISIINDGNNYSIICRKICRETVKIMFKSENSNNYTDVRIAGDFNSWNPEGYEMVREGDMWTRTMTLDCGLYQYQIVADGNYYNNPDFGDTIPNGIGGYNTLLDAFQVCYSSGLALETSGFDEATISIALSDVPDILFVLWQNQIIPVNLKNLETNLYTVNIPEQAKEIDRSYIRVYASKDDCIANDLFIPLKNGKVIDDIIDIERGDKFSNIMYFILTDRFFNGCSNNDKKLSDQRVKEKANFQGGDLFGVLQKLNEGYFDTLGVNCLWISPIFKNPDHAYMEYPAPHRYFSGYHGYWPVSLTEIDNRFGNDSVFSSLIDVAHSRGMNVIIDFVANHVHENNPLYQSNKNWATELELEDGRKNIRLWDEYRLTTWFDTFLPSWDFSNNVVADTISDFAMYWIDKFNVDGFRHDATKHIPESFWRLLTKKIKNDYNNKSIFQIGETFGNRRLISNYIGSGMMDSQFDFNLYFDARNCFADVNYDMKILAKSLISSLSYYGYHNLMGNITGNHDLIRFICVADSSVLPGEDDKEAGWNRDIQIENESSYRKLTNLTAFIMSIPGVPCIYYGDEIGLPGVGDPDNRRMMKFDNLSDNERNTFKNTADLISIRKNNIEFLLGTTKVIVAEEDIFIIKRKYFEHESYIIFNNSDKVRNAFIPKSLIGDISDYKKCFSAEIIEHEENIQIRLKPISCEILIRKNFNKESD